MLHNNLILSLVSGLLEFLKYGLPGLSAIVFILAYRMLSKEQSRDGEARDNVLNMIRTFLWIALVFLIISGVWSIYNSQTNNTNLLHKDMYANYNIQFYYRDTADEGISGRQVIVRHFREDSVIKIKKDQTDNLGAKLFSFKNVNPFTDYFRIEWKKTSGDTEFQDFNPLNHRVVTVKETN